MDIKLEDNIGDYSYGNSDYWSQESVDEIPPEKKTKKTTKYVLFTYTFHRKNGLLDDVINVVRRCK